MKYNIEEALYYMVTGKLENDNLCKLVVGAALNWRQVSILRALVAYMGQIGFVYSGDYIKSLLVSHHLFVASIVRLFESKFDPETLQINQVDKIEQELTALLNKVTSNVEDKVLRTLWHVVNAITRTNCFLKSVGNEKPYISFKFNSAKLPDLPLPIPYAEIFVYSSEFEAIHLRGGAVARGGLRWSDRVADYRTEALGLMKAQMTKNTVIVPVGSKGAFYVKVNKEGLDHKGYMLKVVESYQNFLRGLLDITDNVIDGKIVRNAKLVIYDSDDPYLVVAADKGTASFSDYANAVSAEYNFWLGDAFASGGSAGYDHKKMGITAKGAWISVTRHFAELGIDVQKDNFTVVGIGDMSGDVFGNGMLMSQSLKLLAAFNHKHIFLDPDPNPELSYKERMRLFELPQSQWSDYDAKIISAGGGVFERSAKTITLSQAVQKMLNIEYTNITPDDLIKSILKMKVDLIWNGGIGTYVKSAMESHLDVGDKTNDNLRCNGGQIAAKIVAEGGNLGFTQLGRIEYALHGGRINTDFIDNSAGVDCSDHEVNIKIALQTAMKNHKISLEERNKLLAKMTNSVSELVLIDNYKQTQAISLLEKSHVYNMGMFSQFIENLETEGLLNREVEFLPSDSEIARRMMAQEKLTRPELAVLLSYSKMWVYKHLSSSKISDDKFLEPLLLEYFPDIMQQDFKNEILSHQLRQEIIVTIITNKIVNQLGGPIINHIRSETGGKICDIVRAYMVVNEIFGIDQMWQEVENHKSLSHEIQLKIFSDLIKLMRRGITWLVRNLPNPIKIYDTINTYSILVKKVYALIGNYLQGESYNKFEKNKILYSSNGFEARSALTFSTLDSGISCLDIVTISLATNKDVEYIADIYFRVADNFKLDWLRQVAEKEITDSYWNRMSIQAIKDDLYDKQRRLIYKIIETSAGKLDFDQWMQEKAPVIATYLDFIRSIEIQQNVDLNMVIIANKQFEMLLRKI